MCEGGFVVSKPVISTLPQKVVITDENEALLEKVVLADMVLEENTLMGNISDKVTGKPLEGVCVKICDNDYQPIIYNFTDVDGNFSLQGKFPSYIRIIAAKKGYITFSSDGLPSTGLDKKAINIEMMPALDGGIVLFGNVRDAQQHPAGGIKITLYKANSLNPYDFSFSNSEGLYVFDNIEPGYYRLSFQSQNYVERIVNLEVGKDQPILTIETVFLKRKNLKGTIYGVITDTNGVPVNNALVVLLNGNNIPIQVTHTNDKGVYLFYRLENGSYTIIAR